MAKPKPKPVPPASKPMPKPKTPDPALPDERGGRPQAMETMDRMHDVATKGRSGDVELR